MPSQSVEDYLKAIFEISSVSGRATTRELSDRLGVTPASVSGMLSKLGSRRPRWVIHEKRRGARLTREGRRRALEVLRHHRLLELFLHKTLGYSWDQVHAEAEKLEHAISEDLEDRIDALLGRPETDPHGHPIPGKDGSMPRRMLRPLSEVKVGQTVAIAEVCDLDPAFLRYLGGLGLLPGVRIQVLSITPYGGPIRITAGGVEQILGREAAEQVLVTRKV
jgi:DtxR family Mn-dependent transcriptional regulator